MKQINGLRYVFLENVTGILNAGSDNAFGCVLAALAGEPAGELFAPGGKWPSSGHVLGLGGRSVAWRVLDSQHFGLPQRRRRLFAVGDLIGDRSGEILFEPGGRDRDPFAGATPWKSIAEKPDCGFAVTGTLASRTRGRRFPGTDGSLSGHVVRAPVKSAAGFHQGNSAASGTIGFQEEMAPTLKSASSGTNMVPGVLVESQQNEWSVRKLAPIECERLQGFPDEWTLVPAQNGKPLSDLSRYRAVGNSMSVPVMGYLGERLMASDCGRLKEVNRRGRTRFSCGYPVQHAEEGGYSQIEVCE